MWVSEGSHALAELGTAEHPGRAGKGMRETPAVSVWGGAGCPEPRLGHCWPGTPSAGLSGFPWGQGIEV